MPRGSSKVNSGSTDVGVSGKANIDISVSGTGAIDGATRKIDELNKKLAQVNQKIDAVKKNLSETQQYLSQSFDAKSVDAMTSDYTKEQSRLNAVKSKIEAEINAVKQKNAIEKNNTNEVNNQLAQEQQKVAEANKRSAIEKEISGSANKGLSNEQAKTAEAQRRAAIEQRINQELERRQTRNNVYGNQALINLIDKNLPGFSSNRMMTNATLNDLRAWAGVYGDYQSMPTTDFAIKYKARPDILRATVSKEMIDNALGAEVNKLFTGVDMFFDGIGRQMWSLGRKIRIIASSFYAIRNAMDLLQNSMAGIDEIKEQAYRLQYYDKYNHGKEYMTNNMYYGAQKARMTFGDYSSIVQTLLENNLSAGSAMNAQMLANVMSKASYVGGATDKGAKNALNTFLSAMASGELKRDNIKNIQMNSIGLIDTIIDGLTKGVNEGVIKEAVYGNLDVEGLKKLADESKLTSSVVLRALSLMEKEVEEKFAKTPKTFTQSMATISNTWNKLMYDMSQNGRGLARISNAVQRLSEYLQTKEGAQALERVASALDALIQFAIKAVETIAGAVDWLNKTIGADNLVKGAIGLGLFKFGKNVLFGSSFYTPEGNLKTRPGFLGSGGMISTFGKAISGESTGGMIGNAISTVKNISDLATISARMGEVAANTGALTTIVDSSGKVISTIAGTTSKTLPGILSGVLQALPLIAGIIGAIGALGGIIALIGAKNDKANEKDINDNNKLLVKKNKYSNLTAEDYAEFEGKATKWQEDRTKTSKIFRVREKNWSPQEFYDFSKKLDSEMAARDAERLQERNDYEKQMLNYGGQIASNTSSALDVTEDFLRNMADMRTRTYRGELLMGSTRVNNNISLNVAYTGDVADFETKVLTAIDNVMVKAKETTLA